MVTYLVRTYVLYLCTLLRHKAKTGFRANLTDTNIF